MCLFIICYVQAISKLETRDGGVGENRRNEGDIDPKGLATQECAGCTLLKAEDMGELQFCPGLDCHHRALAQGWVHWKIESALCTKHSGHSQWPFKGDTVRKWYRRTWDYIRWGGEGTEPTNEAAGKSSFYLHQSFCSPCPSLLPSFLYPVPTALISQLCSPGVLDLEET